MKSTYVFIAFVAILLWNSVLIKRDRELFKAYDKLCSELSQPHPECRYAK
jgi:hypothetical protein